MDNDPPRLVEEPRMTEIIRAMRQGEPPPATDARVLDMLSSKEASVSPLRHRAGSWMLVGIAAMVLSIATWAIVMRPRNEPSHASTPVSELVHETPRIEPPEREREEEPIELLIVAHEQEEPRQAPVIARARPPTPDSLPSEEELIFEARRAIPRDLARASSFLTRHARLYPRGVMAEERDALAIEMLLARGERERAAARLASWRRRYPNSAHALRLDRMLEASSSEGSGRVPSDAQQTPDSRRAR